MTDTEILDALQQAYTMAPKRMPSDVQIGNVVFTLGIRPGTLRELMIAAIDKAEAAQAERVADALCPKIFS